MGCTLIIKKKEEWKKVERKDGFCVCVCLSQFLTIKRKKRKKPHDQRKISLQKERKKKIMNFMNWLRLLWVPLNIDPQRCNDCQTPWHLRRREKKYEKQLININWKIKKKTGEIITTAREMINIKLTLQWLVKV